MKPSLIAFLLLPWMVTTCTIQGQNSGDDTWDDGSGEYLQEYDSYAVVALESKVTKVQPMTGIVTWADSGFKNKDWLTLEFAYMLYNDVCKVESISFLLSVYFLPCFIFHSSLWY